MELLKIAMFFASLACMTFGKFVESQARYNMDRLEETADATETLQDPLSQREEPRSNDYVSLAVAADGPARLRNLCETKTGKVKTSRLLGESDADFEYHPSLLFETFCASDDSDGVLGRCGGANYCASQTQKQLINWRAKNSNGRWRRKFITIRGGCSCMAPY